MTLLMIYGSVLSIMSLLGFIMMGIDKLLARWGMRRISEKTLLGTGALGGAAGAWLGMVLFRHKTKHRAFSVGLPVMTVIQGAILIGLVLLESRGGLE